MKDFHLTYGMQCNDSTEITNTCNLILQHQPVLDHTVGIVHVQNLTQSQVHEYKMNFKYQGTTLVTFLRGSIQSIYRQN